MKKLLLFFALLGTLGCEATTCVEYSPKSDEVIKIEQVSNEPQRYFVIPAVVNEQRITAVYLRAVSDKGTELFVPIVYELNGDFAKAQLWMTENFINARIEAKYGEEECGPRIYKDVGI